MDPKPSSRVCKVVQRKPKGTATAYKYRVWEYRVVECEPHQEGHLSERGVRLIWKSESCTYASDKPGTKDYEQRAIAERKAAHGNRALRLGFQVDTPAEVLNDFELERSDALDRIVYVGKESD